MNSEVSYTLEYWTKLEGQDWKHTVQHFTAPSLDEAKRRVQMTQFPFGVIYNITLSETPVPAPKPTKYVAAWKQNPLTRFASKRSK